MPRSARLSGECTASRHCTTRKLYSHFLSDWMGYDRGGDSLPFDFLKQMEFYLVQNWKENRHHDHIQFNVKGNGITVLSVCLQSASRRFMMAPLNPSIRQCCDGTRGFRGSIGHAWWPTEACLSDNYTRMVAVHLLYCLVGLSTASICCHKTTTRICCLGRILLQNNNTNLL